MLNQPTLYCPKCGYDLTGLPHPRCPECGSPFERSALEAKWFRLRPISTGAILFRISWPAILLWLTVPIVMFSPGVGIVAAVVFLIGAAVNAHILAHRVADTRELASDHTWSDSRRAGLVLLVTIGLWAVQVSIVFGGCAVAVLVFAGMRF